MISIKYMHALCRFRAILVLFVSALTLAAGPALAQWSVHAERPWRSDVATIDMDDLAEALTLSPEQHAHVDRLIADHREDFEDFVKENRPVEKRAYNRRTPPGVSEEAHQAARLEAMADLSRIAKRHEKMQRDVIAKIAPILSDAQRAQWRYVRMALHREWWLDRGSQLSEEKIDLIALLDEIDEDPDETQHAEAPTWRDHTALAAVMSQYAQQLDHLLLDRRSRQMKLQRDNWDMVVRQEGRHEMDAEALRTFHEHRRAIGRRHTDIRDLNRQYRDIALGHLAQADAAALQRAYRAAQWPYQGRDRLPGLTFAEALLDNDTLPEQQHQVISALLDVHRPRAHDLADRIADAWDEYMLLGIDPDTADRVEDRARAEAEAHKHTGRYYDLDDALIKSVWDALTPQQQANLTRPTPADRRWMNR